LAGNTVTGAAAGGGFLTPGVFLVATTGGGGATCFSSLEVQLDMPKAANNESTTTVNAMRAGVHSRFPELVFLISDILVITDVAKSRRSITLETARR
jgi:hypothetical protein